MKKPTSKRPTLDELVFGALSQLQVLHYNGRSIRRYQAIWNRLIKFAKQNNFKNKLSENLILQFLEYYDIKPEELTTAKAGWRKHAEFSLKILWQFSRYGYFERIHTLKITDQRKKTDFACFIKELVDVHYPSADKIMLVMDNLNTHNGSSLYETFEPAEAKRILDKLEIHHTPKHGSWLNIAEIELSHLSRQCLDRRIPDKETFIRETNAWCKERNENNSTVDWQFTTNDARIKLKKLYPVIKTV